MLVSDPRGSVPAVASFFVGSPGEEGVPDGGDWEPPENWYGNVQYLINISIIGALCCLIIFLFVKLRSDHQLPGTSGLVSKLLAVWHTTGQQVSRLCGADASQYLAAEGYSFLGFLAVALPALLLALPINVYGGSVSIEDQFSRSTVVHIAKGSYLLWGHFLSMLAAVGVMHLCIQAVEERLSSTRLFGDATADSVAAFTLMIHGIPRTLATNKRPLQEYFDHFYPGKIYRVIVPSNLFTFHSLEQNLMKKRQRLAWLQAHAQSRSAALGEADVFMGFREGASGFVDMRDTDDRFAMMRNGWNFFCQCWHFSKATMKHGWFRFLAFGGCTEEDIIFKLQQECANLESRALDYRECRASGAGIAFVLFKDVHTASRALQDIKSQSGRHLSSVSETELARRHWRAERAPPARDIHWHHLGCSKISRCFRRVIVNSCLLLLLLFCTSPLAAFTALHNVGRLINPEAMEHVQLWLTWVQSSSWAAAIILQFLPNVLIFLSMYILIPAVLSCLSSFESHVTLSGEQSATLGKTVLFFLVNLIFLRGVLENSLENVLLHMGRCYVEGADCKDVEKYMNSSFLANSCLSATAFLITSSFLGISYDLLSPIPWIKRKFQKSKRQHLIDHNSESLPLDHTMTQEDSLHEDLLPDDFLDFLSTEAVGGSVNIDGNGEDVALHPLARDAKQRKNAFNYAQYYAFNLTIFAMSLIYSSFVPLIVPIAALYFGYRYMVDKYNFLFMYRVHGFPATNDGRLMATVIRVMKISVILYLSAMLYFFYYRGDKEKLQFLFTLVVVVLVCMKYGVEKLVSPLKDGFHSTRIECPRSLESYINGATEYELLATPNFGRINLSTDI